MKNLKLKVLLKCVKRKIDFSYVVIKGGFQTESF